MSYYDQQDEDRPERPQRELTLSPVTILGIFFGLALVCAAFFGFGYSMGTRAHQASVAAAAPTSTDFNSFKPSPGAPAIQPVPGYLSAKDAAAANASAANNSYNPPAVTSTASTVTALPAAHTATTAARDETVPAPATAEGHAAAARPPVATAVLPPAAPGSFMVQVAAVSHQEDADLLVSALKRKGYPVASHTEPGDHYFHIQIGPFPSKAAAEPTRQRLVADGYNALIK